MTLITDGGSTKCDWVLLDSEGEIVFRTTTPGLNPAVSPRDELSHHISTNDSLRSVFQEVKKVDFYGAGCGTATPRSILTDVLEILFPQAKVTVSEDLRAAVFAVTSRPGIVCILGTGSNSCYYDGKNIYAPVPALGFILMDEASGNYFGKRLLRDYFYQRMPKDIAVLFANEYNLDADAIKVNLYKNPNPNAYLASFAEFIFKQPPEISYFQNLIKNGIFEFIDCRVIPFENAHKVPIHFIGSVAYFAEDIIKECLAERNLKLGNILQRPIDGLIEHYRKIIIA